MYTPLNYESLNFLDGTRIPSTHHSKNTFAFNYWQRSLYERALSVFTFNVPYTGGELDFFKWCVTMLGKVTFFESDKLGLAFQPFSPSGFNFYYQPLKCLLSNPLLDELEIKQEMEIGTDCEILKFAPDWTGWGDIIDFYATQLAEMTTALSVAETNAKVPNVMGANSKASAEALKKIIDKINSGESFVAFDSKLLFDEESEENPIKSFDLASMRVDNYILDRVLQDFATILANFDNEIGIPTMPYQKKERMVVDEVGIKMADGSARCKVWLNTMNSCFETINKHFGTNMSVKYNYDESEVVDDEQSNNDIDRTL